MSRNKVVAIDIFAVAVLVIGGMAYLFSGPLAERRDVETKEAELEIRKAKLTQTGKPLKELKEAAESGIERVDKSAEAMKSLELEITEKYVPEGKDNPPNYFKQLLVGLRKQVADGQAGPAFPLQVPLGFTPKMEEKESVRRLLLAVAAAERVVAILKKTGNVEVVSIEHLPVRVLGGVEEVHPAAAMLPVRVTFYGSERQASKFLTALSARDTAGALESFRMESVPDKQGLKVEAQVGFMVRDASGVLPKVVNETTPKGSTTPIRRW
ncbi:MAG: hypothetical protein JW909_02800 [Planctomycetes bacterium]|nr:hypothetical protein [Planctomycetota bacterium]